MVVELLLLLRVVVMVVVTMMDKVSASRVLSDAGLYRREHFQANTPSNTRATWHRHSTSENNSKHGFSVANLATK